MAKLSQCFHRLKKMIELQNLSIETLEKRANNMLRRRYEREQNPDFMSKAIEKALSYNPPEKPAFDDIDLTIRPSYMDKSRLQVL